jgi:ferrous iron transport protein B
VALRHATSSELTADGVRVLLMGNPNVGKSAVFSRLTGAQVIASNYPGTTVTFTEGVMELGGHACRVVDVPGTYSLQPDSRAEQVAVEILDRGGTVINVLDATNLERNLNLTLQLIRRRVPMVLALNMWDEAVEHGIRIDVDRLARRLGVPVVPTCAISGEGIRKLQESLKDARTSSLDCDEGRKWQLIGGIVEDVQRLEPRSPSLGQRLSHATVHPVVGPVFALAVLGASFEVVRLVGEGLIRHVAEPLFRALWLPAVEKLSALLGSGGFVHDLLIGRLEAGSINFGTSFGLLTTGLYIPLAQVLPYVFAFYLVLGILEDSGYLPRLGVVMDNVMHRVGLHGLSIVSMLLGLGCMVPAALSLRVLETRKERFIAATLLGICVPCMAQIAMLAALLGPYGAAGFLPVFGTLFLLWIGLGGALKRFTRGTTPEMLLDIPPYRVPYWRPLALKLRLRMVGFLKDGEVFVLLGVLIINLLHTLGIMGFAGRALGPVMMRLLGLPPGAVGALLAGLLRKDVAVGMLVPLHLSLRQLIVASVVLAAYFPCAAAFITLWRELGARDMLKSSAIMVLVAFSAGGVLNLLMAGIGL